MVAKKRREAGMNAQAKGPGPKSAPTRGLAIALATVGMVVVVAAASWSVWALLNRPLVVTPDRTELAALDARLTTIEGAIAPIATSFTSEPATGPIDVGSYRARIAAAQRIVDSTNDLSVSTPDSIEVRDLIITGGSQVLAGLNSALDALQSDEASATQPAAAQVDEGLATLKDARDKLDALLGKKSGV
jgi:hypothetical protein